MQRWILPLSQQAVWMGIQRQISMTCRILGKRSHTWKVQNFHALSSCRTAFKTSEIIHFTSTLYVSNICIDVIILHGRCHSTTKTEILASVRNLHRTLQLAKNIPCFQNADSQFLVNIIIRSILTLLPSSKHRHLYYAGIIQIFELRFLEGVCDLQILCAWNMIPRVPHDFMHD